VCGEKARLREQNRVICWNDGGSFVGMEQNKSNEKPREYWCGRRDSNPHDVTISGF
jgi:hypothetical protein